MDFVMSFLIFFFFQTMKVYLLQIQNIYTFMGFTSADFSVDAFKTFIGISAFFLKNKDPL